MINTIQKYLFQQQEIRTVTNASGETQFCAADICKILDIGNPRETVAKLDDDEKNTVITNDGIRGNPSMNFVSESGLYHLIFVSRKPEANAFRRWVTKDVLPAIRKNGFYGSPPEFVSCGDLDLDMVKLDDSLKVQAGRYTVVKRDFKKVLAMKLNVTRVALDSKNQLQFNFDDFETPEELEDFHDLEDSE